MDFASLGDEFPEYRFLVQVKGEAFETLMGADWARAHPDVPILLAVDELAAMAAEQRLEMSVIVRATERFLSDSRALEGRSSEVVAARALYRELYARFVPDFWQTIQGRMTAEGVGPGDRVRMSVRALNLWPGDVRTDPQAWQLWFFAGFDFVQLEDKERAKRFLEQSIAAYPNAVPPLNELSALLLSEGRREEGEALVNKVLELEPDNLTALCNAGGLRIEAGRVQEALPYLKRAQAVKPGDSRVEFLLKRASSPP